MNEYVLTRVGIAALLSGFFVIVDQFYTDHFTGWTLVLLVTTIVGFSHYFIGAVYQIRSFARLQRPVVAYRWFLLLMVVAALVSGVFLFNGQVALFSFLSIGYFMTHGFFNEITLYERTTGHTANRSVIGTLALWITGLMLLTTSHPSAYFSPQLEYLIRDDFFIQLYLSTTVFPQLGLWLSIAVQGSALLLLVGATVRRALSIRHALILTVILMSASLAVYYLAIGYIYMFALLLLYHYIVWFIFFLIRFYRTSQSAVHQYLLLHALAFLPFTLLATTDRAVRLIDVFILNSYVFLLLTAIHITTSYMSETWFKKRFLS